jgi:hypothetical protein
MFRHRLYVLLRSEAVSPCPTPKPEEPLSAARNCLPPQNVEAVSPRTYSAMTISDRFHVADIVGHEIISLPDPDDNDFDTCCKKCQIVAPVPRRSFYFQHEIRDNWENVISI